MNHSTHTFTVDQHDFFYQTWTKENVDLNIVVVHGGLEHSGRYQNLIEYFGSKKVSFYAMDLRGHGRDAGPLGDGESIDQNVEDVAKFLTHLKEKGVEKPLLIGHSMGGLICLQLVRNPIYRDLVSALITSGAAVKIKYNPLLKIKECVGKYVVAPLVPKMKMSAGLKLKYLSHDEKVIEDYVKDPYVLLKLSVSFMVDIVESGKDLLENAGEIKDIPILMTHGELDGIALASGSKEVFDKIQSPNKELKIFPGLYHEIFNEATKEDVLGFVGNWIESRFKLT